jgi:thiamine-phosphate pyrophosphorylase
VSPYSVEALRRALGVYLVTDPDVGAGRPLLERVEEALAGGVTCVQVRDKRAGGRALVELTRALVARCRPLGVPVLVNDRLDVALVAGADGLHVGASDVHPLDARACLPPGAILGFSVESLAEVRAAEALPVDYLGVSPVFATPTKTDTAPPFGLAGLAIARALTARPLVAIGGIHPENAAAVMAAGADGLAVVSAVLAAPNPRLAAEHLAAIVRTAHAQETRP